MLLNLLNAQTAESQSRFISVGEAALYALIGFAVVFFGIAFLIFIVWVVGKILSNKELIVKTLDGAIKITKLQLAGKNIVTGKEFMNGSFKKFNSDIFE